MFRGAVPKQEQTEHCSIEALRPYKRLYGIRVRKRIGLQIVSAMTTAAFCALDLLAD